MCTLQTSYLGHHQKFQRKNDLDALVYTFFIFLFCRLICQCLTQAPSKNIDKLDDRTKRDNRIERHLHIEHSLTRLTSLVSLYSIWHSKKYFQLYTNDARSSRCAYKTSSFQTRPITCMVTFWSTDINENETIYWRQDCLLQHLLRQTTRRASRWSIIIVTGTKTSDTSVSTSSSACTSSTYVNNKRRLSIGSIDEHAAELKKLKSNFIELHSEPVAMHSKLSTEINAYLPVNVACDDVLLWWKNVENLYPRLAQLTRIVSAVPSTSTPSE